jgi:hypothetical protein
MLNNIPRSSLCKLRKPYILLMLCLTCYAHSSFAQTFVKKGNTVTYRGNAFELSAPIYDTQTIVDPVTDKKIKKVENKGTVPVKMNGRKIYRTYELFAAPATYLEFGPLGDYIFRELRDELNKLPNGNYVMLVDNIVVDDIGKIVYYEYHGMRSDNPKTKVSAIHEKPIIKKLDMLMTKAAPFRPGQVQQYQNAIARTDITFDMYTIEIRDHKTTIKKQ